MKHSLVKGLLAVAVSAPALMAATPSQALTFNLISTGAGTDPGTLARQGFEVAASYWSSVIKDPVTVNLQIGFNSLGAGILGSAGSNKLDVSNTVVYNALVADASSVLDTSAVANLPTLGASNDLSVIVNETSQYVIDFTSQGGSWGVLYSDRGTRLDADASANNQGLWVNTANLKALGLLGATATPDASISFNSDFAAEFDFDPIDGIGTNKIDFIGVAIHEIGHALGFVSGVDYYDYYTYDVPVFAAANDFGFLDQYYISSVLDLFRYSQDGLDWSTSATDKYFSIDGGATEFLGEASFSTGTYNGNGRQASHWLPPVAPNVCTGFIGVMNPYLCDEEQSIVTAEDLGAFDAIGWDFDIDVLADPGYQATTANAYQAYLINAGIPEPATWIQMITGFALLGGALRARTRRTTVTA